MAQILLPIPKTPTGMSSPLIECTKMAPIPFPIVLSLSITSAVAGREVRDHYQSQVLELWKSDI